MDSPLSLSTEKNVSPKYQCNDREKSLCTGKQLHAHVNEHLGLTCDNCSENLNSLIIFKDMLRTERTLSAPFVIKTFVTSHLFVIMN